VIDWDEIYARYNIEDLVTSRGVQLKGSSRGKWCLCVLPMHEHHSYTPSFSVYFTKGGKQRWKCHGQCNVSGDVIDLAGYLWVPGYHHDPKLRVEAAMLLTGGSIKTNRLEVPPPIPTLPQWLWKDMLPPNNKVIQYAVGRGLTVDQIDKFRIGSPTPEMKEKYNLHTPHIWMAMPTFHNGELMGIKMRNITHKGLRYMGIAGSRKGLFNYDAVNLSTGTVLVLKGEIAVMVADRFGFLACAPTGGEGSYVRDVKGALILSRNIVIGDNDPGEGKERARQQAFQRAAMLNAEVFFPPDPYKDIDAWLLSDPGAADTIRGWMK
jgi:hypothetical protein